MAKRAARMDPPVGSYTIDCDSGATIREGGPVRQQRRLARHTRRSLVQRDDEHPAIKERIKAAPRLPHFSHIQDIVEPLANGSERQTRYSFQYWEKR